MLLIIPSIHILGGTCMPKIDYNKAHHLPDYDDPSERTRLLRMENAKALHLFFDVEEPFTDENLARIQVVRTSVDLPLGLTISVMPSVADIKKLFANGIYRISFRSYDDIALLKEVTASFTPTQLAFYYVPGETRPELLSELRKLGVCRLTVDPSDLTDATLGAIEAELAPYRMRLSVITRVLEYSDFERIRRVAPSIDSLIFDGILEHDSFPCQKLWRIDEERAFIAQGGEANLWRNPLEGVPHI